MEEINADNYRLIAGEDGNFIIEDNKCLLQRVYDEALVYVDADIVSQAFQITLETVNPNSSNHSVDVEKNEIRTTWTREEILNLIDLYKQYESKFKSTTVKNDKVWHEISTKIHSHTWEQCKNKFKYLKSKYVEKKDNMGPNATGAKAIKFDYFEEMDQIFRQHPNITPVAIASSSRGIKNLECINLNQENSNTPDNGKRKGDTELEEKQNKKMKPISTSTYRDIQVMKEDGRNKRHQERLAVQKELINVLKDIVNVLNRQ